MNIRSLLKVFIAEQPPVQKEAPKETAAPQVSSRGIASATDSFETSKVNFFSGEKLDADSLNQEQDYSRGMFDPHKRYSGVVMQEGRIQTDSDVNESSDVNDQQKNVFLRDSAFTSFKDNDD
jgi:hypothetical protein